MNPFHLPQKPQHRNTDQENPPVWNTPTLTSLSAVLILVLLLLFPSLLLDDLRSQEPQG